MQIGARSKLLKNELPTFLRVVEEMRVYFKVDIRATRINLYKGAEGKALHFDAAKFNKKMDQNITIALSLGNERDITFQHDKKRTLIDIVSTNNSIYTFGKRVNEITRHGVRPDTSEKTKTNPTNGERISVIIWGKVDL